MGYGIVKQAASFSIDETGAEAAAVSSGELIDTSPGSIDPNHLYTVKVDRPFFFFINEFSSGACVLSGRISDL
ncbi:MAG: hypothetical protein K1W02_12690 [Muribaculaceae bacterium]